MSEELKNESANQAEQLDTQPEVNGTQSGSGDGERKFTQDEVNRIVKERLQRERNKAGAEQAEQLTAKAAELAALESRLACKEYLLDSGYPPELLDAIDTSNPENFKSKAVAVVNALQSRTAPVRATPSFEPEPMTGDGIAEAFRESAKHIPRGRNYDYQ